MKDLELIIDYSSEKFTRIKNRTLIFEDKYLQKVSEIIDDVKNYGDKSLVEYTAEFDGYEIVDTFSLDRDNLKVYYDELSSDLKKALIKCRDDIENFHKNQCERSFFTKKSDNVILGQIVNPLDRVGVYAPGGKATYPSTVIMSVVPAKVAGVKEIFLCSPSIKGKINKVVMAAAYIAGVDRVFRIGGAQAIAALAFGTESIPKVDKIVGPGNIFVSLAKKLVFGIVDIDMIAGPTELIIIADKKGNPAYIASDMLAQAEHDELASVLTFVTTEQLATSVEQELNLQLDNFPRKEIAINSLKEFGGIIVVDNIYEAINYVNEIAPEHLELHVEDPMDYLNFIRNAGAIFMGSYTPVATGDYIAGPNHTLPTSGTARFFSPLGVYDFIKRSSIIKYNKIALGEEAEYIIKLANEEGLIGHSNSVKIRLK
jgi:histidinol dehydrogenase